MEMGTWWWGIISYAVCHLLHIAAWRIKTPAKQFPTLLFFLCLPAALLVYFSPTAALTHFCFASSYIAIYPAFQAVSPTIEIVDLLRRVPGGLTRQELITTFASPALVDDRLSDLYQSGLLIKGAGGPILSTRAKYLARFFRTYRALLGLSEGGG